LRWKALRALLFVIFLRSSEASGDLGKGSNPGARARSDARKAITNRAKGSKAAKSKPGGSGFAEAWLQNPSNRARPFSSAANRLAQQFQPGQAEGGNGLSA
jgi:hypothetical protein